MRNVKQSSIIDAVRRAQRHGLFCVFLVCAASHYLAAQTYEALQHRSWGTTDGLPQNSVHAIAQTPDGFLWIATEAGLARFDGNQFTDYNPDALGRTVSEDICCLAVDARGVLWVGSSFGIAAIDRLQTISLPDRAPFTRTSIQRLSLRNGEVVATADSGAFLLRSDGSVSRVGPASTSPVAPPVLKDHQGNLWLGSVGGLREVSARGATVSDVSFLKRQSILSLLEDQQGTLWVGTETTGLHRLNRSVFTTAAGTGGVPTVGVGWSSRGMLQGTRDGELRLVSASGQSTRLAHIGSGITALAVSADVVWAGTTDGLYRIDGKTGIRRYTSADGLPDDYIRSLAVNKDGDVWAGTAHGLAHFTASHFEILTAPDRNGGDLIGALLPAPSEPHQPAAVWAATESGLLRFEGSRITNALNVGGPVVADMSYDQSGVLWFATQDGWLWQSHSGGARRVLQLPLASHRQAVEALYVDRRNTLWIVLHDGLLSASIARLAQCASETCRSLTSLVANWSVADGIPSTETLPGGFVRPTPDSQGNVLLATRAGVAVADADQAARTFQVPVVIERIELENQPLDAVKRQSIPYGRTRLTFDFQGIALSDPGRVRYRVRLEGFDPAWVETGVRRNATYTALPPGDYRLRVQATLDGQPWPDASTSVSFRIAPPFYRRWWFLLLTLFLLIGLYLIVSRLRLSAERRRFALVMAERNRLAREVHDTLAQDLVSTGIQLDVILFALNHQPRESAMEMLRTLRRSVGQALAEARESIGDLRNPTLRFDLESRLRRTAERKSTNTTPVTMEVSGPLEPLTSGVEMELLRIASEAIDNAMRHAHATSVAVQVHSGADTLSVSIIDNGKGFSPADAEAMTAHYGLRGMQERAETIGAALSIASKPGTGTNVRVSVGYR